MKGSKGRYGLWFVIDTWAAFYASSAWAEPRLVASFCINYQFCEINSFICETFKLNSDQLIKLAQKILILINTKEKLVLK